MKKMKNNFLVAFVCTLVCLFEVTVFGDILSNPYMIFLMYMVGGFGAYNFGVGIYKYIKTPFENSLIMEHKYLVSYTYWDSELSRQMFKAKTIKVDLSVESDYLSEKILQELGVDKKYLVTIIAVSKID